MRYQLLLIFVLLSFSAKSQVELEIPQVMLSSSVANAEGFQFDPGLTKLQLALRQAPSHRDKEARWVSITLPFPDGTIHNVEVAEAPVVADKLYQSYPQNRSYVVRGVQDKYISGRMAITSLGLSAMLYTQEGNVMIEPTEGNLHRSYEYNQAESSSYHCGTDHSRYKRNNQASTRRTSGAVERKYRIAVASTGEFSARYNNNLTDINAQITTYLTLLNTLYERDLSITFELVADNDDIIFFDAATDGLEPGLINVQLNSAHTVINNAIGSANYDLGHVFYDFPVSSNSVGGSGVAGLEVVCKSSSKGRGWSGAGGNYSNSFFMRVFAHEVGHQFGAKHTFYGTSGLCDSSERSQGDGVEPGSGTTLMSYQGTCGASDSCTSQNITPAASTIYFHSHTVDQIEDYVGASGGCFASTPTNNAPPVISMPSNVTIPKSTPFVLTASATDADGDPLILNWEEIDTDNLDLTCPAGQPNDAATSATAPLFRSFDPSPDGGTRYFPQLSDILDDTQTLGEILPAIGRGIDMRFIARGTDVNGISGVSYEDMLVTVAGNAGPFEVTTASAPSAYLAGDNVNVDWLVNNTNMAPVSCTMVNILFSTDGGLSFPIVLASAVPNDGSHTVTMPVSATEEGRIKVESVGNVFFSINKAEISVISDCEQISSSILNDGAVTAPVGSASLNLGLQLGGLFTTASSSLDASDANTALVGENTGTGNCIAFTNNPKYESYVLTALATDVYNFTSSSPLFEVVNIYENEFFPPITNCQNWLASNLSNPPVSLSGVTSVSLNAGDVIEVVVSGFNTSDIGNYTLNVSSNGSGNMISSPTIPTGYVYKYVIYNSSDYIVEIKDEADLSNGATYYNDSYTVRGIMTLGSTDLASYINETIASLQSDLTAGLICGTLSTNDVSVTVVGCNASTRLVTSTSDNAGATTLRSLVENACPNDIIQFDPSLMGSTIVLNSEIIVGKNVVITSLGPTNLSLSGNSNSRIFNITSGTTCTISNLSMINGSAATNGGAFLNNGSLTIKDVVLEGNNSGGNPKAFTNLGTLNSEGIVEVKE